MKRVFKSLLVLAGLLGLALPVVADAPPQTVEYPLAVAWDLDGEAADADQVVASATLADSTSYTIAANPDVCRLVDVTITDADSSITAGVLTVVGTDCWDDALTTTFTFAAGGSGVKTLVVSSGKASAAYFKTVTSVSNALLTGEGVGDALTVGYTSNSQSGFPAYGWRQDRGNQRLVDLKAVRQVLVAVKNGAANTDITEVTANTNPFTSVAAGDLLYFNIAGIIYTTKVVTRTDDSNLIVSPGVTIPASTQGLGPVVTGTYFSYKRFYYSTDPVDGWVSVSGFQAGAYQWQVIANTNTGGVVSSITCRSDSFQQNPQIETDTDTVASTATGSVVSSIDFRLAAYPYCRAGFKFGTGDDDDSPASEIENIYVSLIATR